MMSAVRPTGHKLSTPADRLDGPIHGLNDVLFRAKSGTHVRQRDLFSLFTLVYFILLQSVRQLLLAHDAHTPRAHFGLANGPVRCFSLTTISPTHSTTTPSSEAAPTSAVVPPAAAPAAVTNAAKAPAPATTVAIPRPSQESKCCARYYLTRSFHATAEVFITGSTTTHRNFQLCSTLGVKMSPLRVDITNMLRSLPSERNRRKNLYCSLRSGARIGCTLFTHM